MQYVNGEATVLDEYDEETYVQTVWQFSDREFKRQLQKVANGGEFDLTTGKVVAQMGHSLDDLTNPSRINYAQDLLDNEFLTQKQQDARALQNHKDFVALGLVKEVTDVDAFLSR